MSEIEKMYDNTIGKQSYCTANDCLDMSKCESCYFCKQMYPPFTAEKQLELIKWLAEYKNEFGLFHSMDYRINKNKWWVCCDKNYEDFLEAYHDTNFEQALAGLINSIWTSCSEEERKQIKDILE